MRVGDNFCPGILHAVPAKDGLLLRIRVPGGLIQSHQLRTIADLSKSHANGQVEITSRANIQLRAISDEALPKVVEGLTGAGLLPSAGHDRVRNIAASPLAGLDAEELVDTRPLVRELDARFLADPVFVELHPKFSLALDGGGGWFSRETDDLTLQAVKVNDTMFFHLWIGGISSGFGVAADGVVCCMLEAAKMCLRVCKELDISVRARAMAAIPGAIESVLKGLSHLLVPCPSPRDARSAVEAPWGRYATQGSDFVSVIPSVPLGRLRAEQAHAISVLAQEWSEDLRLTPWRGVVLGSMPAGEVDGIVRFLRSAGLSDDGRDGYRGVAACAGSVGCEASLADVRGDAAILALRLFGRATIPGWTVNISGCEKQCAMRKGATAELVANELGYSVKIQGTTVASDCSAGAAIDAVVACQGRLAAEAYS